MKCTDLVLSLVVEKEQVSDIIEDYGIFDNHNSSFHIYVVCDMSGFFIYFYFFWDLDIEEVVRDILEESPQLAGPADEGIVGEKHEEGEVAATQQPTTTVVASLVTSEQSTHQWSLSVFTEIFIFA